MARDCVMSSGKKMTHDSVRKIELIYASQKRQPHTLNNHNSKADPKVTAV